jgi:hypothetical protein
VLDRETLHLPSGKAWRGRLGKERCRVHAATLSSYVNPAPPVSSGLAADGCRVADQPDSARHGSPLPYAGRVFRHLGSASSTAGRPLRSTAAGDGPEASSREESLPRERRSEPRRAASASQLSQAASAFHAAPAGVDPRLVDRRAKLLARAEEDLRRENLNAVEEAKVLAQLLEAREIDVREVGELIGRSYAQARRLYAVR